MTSSPLEDRRKIPAGRKSLSQGTEVGKHVVDSGTRHFQCGWHGTTCRVAGKVAERAGGARTQRPAWGFSSSEHQKLLKTPTQATGSERDFRKIDLRSVATTWGWLRGKEARVRETCLETACD